MAQIKIEDSSANKSSDRRQLLQIFNNRYNKQTEDVGIPQHDIEPVPPHEDYHHDEENESKNIRTAMLGIGAGFMFLILVEEVMSMAGLAHSHSHGPTNVGGKDESDEEEEEGHTHSHKPPTLRSSLSAVAFVGLAFHSLVDGMIIAGAFTASPEVGSRVALAILLHKFPDGFVMSSIVASQQIKIWNVHPFTYILLIAAMTPLGAVIGAWLMGSFTTVAVGFILGFGAGTFLFITTVGILPDLLKSKGSDKIISIACIVAGYLGFLLIDSSLHAH